MPNKHELFYLSNLYCVHEKKVDRRTNEANIKGQNQSCIKQETEQEKDWDSSMEAVRVVE